MNMEKNRLNKIREFAKLHYKDDDLHGWGHIERVMNNAKRIQKHTGGDWSLIQVAVWLHDIGRKKEEQLKMKVENKQPPHHAILSKTISKKFLENLSLEENTIKQINHIILAHSFSIGEKARSVEAKIVSDADKLDAIGAIGIFRASAYQFHNKTGISGMLNHMEEKLMNLAEKMYLDISRKIAKKRILRIKKYREMILEELD